MVTTQLLSGPKPTVFHKGDKVKVTDFQNKTFDAVYVGKASSGSAIIEINGSRTVAKLYRLTPAQP